MNTEASNSALSSTLTDLMTSLAVIFVLLLVAALNNMKQEGEQTRNAILFKLQEELQKELRQYGNEGFEVKSDPKDPLSLIVIVPEGLLNFEINRTDVPVAGVQFLQAIIPKLALIVCSSEFNSDIASIVVEGHTDTTGNEAINLPLSQGRSLAVVTQSLRILDSSGLADSLAESQVKMCFLKLISATGRGSVDPYIREGVIDLMKSRRVVFKIRVRSAEQRVVNTMAGVR